MRGGGVMLPPGAQSIIEPAGSGAAQIAVLFWWMVAGALLVWLGVVVLAFIATREPRPDDARRARRLIIGGGAVLPTLVLAALLVYALPLMPVLRAPATVPLKIAVTGEQWWWRVRYLPPDGAPIELANELRLPRGERIELVLDSADVIHSLWVPSIGGKVDMIPGRTTRLVLEPTVTGRFRGQCAEFCGSSHALMAFFVEVMEPSAFDDWLRAQAAQAAAPQTPLARRGAQLFLQKGCGACHRVRGTAADGRFGPDLTHLGSRLSLAAGVLPNTPQALAQWMAHPGAIKPDVRMPPFDMLVDHERAAIAAYLHALQ